ncbi:uncharacterized protein [Apostichopus japonicus]|uniref:uncharacterized protein n=1 Tax=Stichopus japonicus TaxID=307972 RepID=UPI003AB67184
MAFGSHTFGRSHSVGVSNVEGLQMKLSDNVKPTPEVYLPHHFQLVESSVLRNGEYTFEAEEAFLSWTRDILEREKSRLESLEELENERRVKANHKHISQTNSEEDHGLPRKKPTPIPEPVLTPVQAQLGTDILMPTPSGSTKEIVDDGTKIVTSGSSNHLFDLADFETVSDPFEATELQTLNDMEELKSVLASSSSSTTAPAAPPPGDEDRADSPGSSPVPGEDPPSTSNVISNSQTEETEERLKITEEAQLETETKSVSFERNVPDNESPFKSQSVPKDSSYLSQSQVDHEDLSQSLDNFISHSTPTNRRQVLNSAPLPPITGKPVSPFTTENNNSHKEANGQRRRSDSSPLDSSTAGIISNHSKTTNPPGYPNNLSRYEPLPPSPAPSSSESMRSETKPEDPDFTALDSESKNFARMIISMGFPEGRTARAVKRLGHDDRLVIDALCAVDRLSNQGFGERKVEEALHLLDNNDEKILAFLKLLKQFEELGFKSDDIKRELLLHGSEEEKVLDALTAKP